MECNEPSAELGQGYSGLRAECKESSAELGQSCGGFSSEGLVHGIIRGLVGQRRGGSGLGARMAAGAAPRKQTRKDGRVGGGGNKCVKLADHQGEKDSFEKRKAQSAPSGVEKTFFWPRYDP